MSIEVIKGTTRKPVSSQVLVDVLSNEMHLSGYLFVGYPIIGTVEGPYIFDALLVSKDIGATVINLIEGQPEADYGALQDDSINKLDSKFRIHPALMDKTDLLIPIRAISFAPAVNQLDEYNENDYPIANAGTLTEYLKQLQWRGRKPGIYEQALSIIQNISTIRQSGSKRTNQRQDSRGAKLKNLEDSIATLDNMQSKAVIETVDGIQRIRGLAGSGKTIVLALKAAYLHAQHPDWRIAVTFYTRSLKGHFRRLINNFSLEQTSQEPDWENLHILNAWGAPGSPERDGIYHQFCHVNNVKYFDFQSARDRFDEDDPFSAICEFATRQAPRSTPYYDALLIDEAQDLPPAFLRLCLVMLKDPKRLVYAYDELQNLSGDSLPSPEVIFQGFNDRTSNLFGSQYSGDPRNDIILHKCYRNSRPVLVTAHALGFGIYRKPSAWRKTGLIQMFDNPQLWTDVGYEICDGTLGDGQQVTLHRSPDTSPPFLETHSSPEDLIQFISFDSEGDQARWVAENISSNLNDDELRHDDILVINPDPTTTRAKVGPVRQLLWDMGISSHLAGVDTDPDIFFQIKSVAFTGIYRAKGNEAGMVYIINAHDCHSSALNLAKLRNQLFTAITRSKAWVRVLGTGNAMVELRNEYSKLMECAFKLNFIYPTADQRKELRIVHRDMTAAERVRLQNRQRSLHELVEDLVSGNVHREDLDDDTVTKLKELLG